MREIEIKAALADRDATTAKLQALGATLSKPVKQHDVVYGQPGMVGGEKEAIWLRIRTENDSKILLTLKMSVVGHLDSLEHELEISDTSEMEAIIKLLGFEPYSDLTKVRTKCKLGNVEICLDNVTGLGHFIEAEKLLAPEADHDAVERELWTLFSQLGIQRSDERLEGYDVLERKQRGL